MWINKKINEEKNILDNLEDQLEELLNTIKPSDKISIWDNFTLKKNVILPYHWKIEKWKSIRISDITEEKEWQTTIIKYQIIWETDEEFEMSKWIFIWYFCEEIKSEEEQIWKKINQLKKQIKFEKDKIKTEKMWKHCEDVKQKVHFLLKLTKAVKKHL